MLKISEIPEFIKAALFLSGEPIDLDIFSEIAHIDDDELDIIVEDLIRELELNESGVLLKRVGNRIQLCTNPKYADYLKLLFEPPKNDSLTQSVLETLSIIAYKQPITRSEIDEIRGVHSSYTITSLKERGLIAEVGKKDTLGRPSLYGTTDEFLRQFGIATVQELPDIFKNEVEDEVAEENSLNEDRIADYGLQEENE